MKIHCVEGMGRRNREKAMFRDHLCHAILFLFISQELPKTFATVFGKVLFRGQYDPTCEQEDNPALFPEDLAQPLRHD